jgi:ketosteroid isomerase-like protein
MTPDPIETLERGYRLLWHERDIERALGGLDDDFEWRAPGYAEGELRHGPEGTIEFFREWIEPWEDLEVEWTLERAPGDRVLAEVWMRGRGRGSGAPVEMHFGQVWTFREGRARRMVMHLDAADARRDAGLS